MTKIDFKQAREFLEKINEKDSVAIVTHNDMDGFCSGRLFLEFCKKKKAKTSVFILNYGMNKLSEFNLKSFNKILLSDLAPSLVSEDLKKLSKEKEILYTDHHQEDANFPISEKVLELRTTNDGYIPSSRTCYELTEKENKNLKFLSALGVISDFGFAHKVNKDFLENLYFETGKSFDFYNEKSKEFNALIIYFAPDFDKAFEKFIEIDEVEEVDKFKEYVDEVEKEFSRLRKDFQSNYEFLGEIIYFNLESKFSAIKSALISSLSSDDKYKIYIFATKKGDKISISGRNQSKIYDVSKILQSCISGLEDSTSGGHKAAAGAVIKKEDLEMFKEKLKQINLEEYKQ